MDDLLDFETSTVKDASDFPLLINTPLTPVLTDDHLHKLLTDVNPVISELEFGSNYTTQRACDGFNALQSPVANGHVGSPKTPCAAIRSTSKKETAQMVFQTLMMKAANDAASNNAGGGLCDGVLETETDERRDRDSALVMYKSVN